MEAKKEIPGVPVAEGQVTVPSRRDSLLFAILGTVIGLALLVAGIAVLWGPGPVLAELPWYVPLISAFVSLTSLSVAYLALGRYQVLRQPISFWVGNGFAAYGIGQIFYALTWADILPDGGYLFGHLDNNAALIATVSRSLLLIFLLAAVLLRWPGKQSLSGSRWLGIVVSWLLLVIVGFILLVFYESQLPILVNADGRFTPLQRTWVTILLAGFAAGSSLSTLYYRRREDRLAGYIAFPQLALVFICMMVLIGGKRYDLWWYVQRVILVLGHLVVFIGLLSEYVRLLQRESEGRQMLEVILKNIPVGLAVTGGPPYFPLLQVSRHGLEMNQRPVESLIGAPAGFHQVVWRIFLPDGVTLPTPEQMPLYRASRFGEEVRNVELIMESQDGQKLPVLTSAAPIRDAQGKIVAAINTWLDIGDQKRVEEALQKLNQQLESRVDERTAELQATNQALLESQQRLQSLSQRLVEVQDEERRAIALVRNVMTDLRPAVLEDYGLEVALQSYINDYQSRYPIHVQFDCPGQPIPRLGSSMEITLLRIAQEALTNVARHAQTDQAKVVLEMVDGVIHLAVQDSGVGMDHSGSLNYPNSHGMKIMRERAEAFGGSVTIQSAPGKGTTVDTVIPVQKREQD